LLPFAEATSALAATAEDLARGSEKEVEVALAGGEVELDRAIVDALRPPLLHLLRNAIDHGIEPRAVRERAGKPPRGRLAISALHRGDAVDVTVADDGAGVDVEGVRAAARARGLPEPERAEDAYRLLFSPRFSTAAAVTTVSGRGIGLDAVRAAVEALYGTIAVASAPGAGTRFTLTVPISASTLRVVVLRAADRVFAVSAVAVERIARVRGGELLRAGGHAYLPGGATRAVELGALLGLRGEAWRAGRREAAPAAGFAVVVRALATGLALLVDAVLGIHDIVVEPLGRRVRATPRVGGGFAWDGSIGLLLKLDGLVEQGLDRAAAPPPSAAEPRAGAAPRVLVADDSLTTRTLVKTILEAAGYRVLVALDGAHAWRILQAEGADAVVSDVEMPELDGVGLTEAIRAAPRLRGLPVILVTSRGSELDRVRGLAAGADAYIVKSAFDQSALLELLSQLVESPP
jgi:two-component system chemotaxis sensor kinase CheA